MLKLPTGTNEQATNPFNLFINKWNPGSEFCKTRHTIKSLQAVTINTSFSGREIRLTESGEKFSMSGNFFLGRKTKIFFWACKRLILLVTSDYYVSDKVGWFVKTVNFFYHDYTDNTADSNDHVIKTSGQS